MRYEYLFDEEILQRLTIDEIFNIIEVELGKEGVI